MQSEALEALRGRIEAEGLMTQFRDDENETLKLLRFLRARKFHVDSAFAMISADLEWRGENDRRNLPNESAAEVLQCDIMQFYAFFPTWLQGHDKQFRPVSYRQFGKFEIWNVLKLTSLERLIRFHAWESEMAIRQMRRNSESQGCNVETYTVVVDSAGWSMRLATGDAFSFIKAMATIDSDHYPERLGTLIVINAPTMLSFAWKIIQGFLDPVTKDKIKIISSRAEWVPVLQDIIDVDQIPTAYGGTAPDLDPETAINGMNPNPSR